MGTCKMTLARVVLWKFPTVQEFYRLSKKFAQMKITWISMNTYTLREIGTLKVTFLSNQIIPAAPFLDHFCFLMEKCRTCGLITVFKILTVPSFTIYASQIKMMSSLAKELTRMSIRILALALLLKLLIS